MLIGASEGRGWCYEVFQRIEGYLVRTRDLDTGSINADDGRLFRTAAVAFAYAQMSAAFDRCAAARIAGEACADLDRELAEARALFEALRRRLGDDGVAGALLTAWEEAADAAERRRFH